GGAADVLHGLGHGVQLLLGPRDEQELAAGRADLQGRGLADPRRRAGDHDRLALDRVVQRVGEDATPERDALGQLAERADAADGEIGDVGSHAYRSASTWLAMFCSPALLG